MELKAVNTLLRIPHRGDIAIVGFAENFEFRREAGHVVSVAHPDLMLPSHAVEEPAVGAHPQGRAAEFLGFAAIHSAPEVLGDDLVPVANPEHRHAEREQAGIRLGSTGVEDTGRPAGQNDAPMRLKLGKRYPDGQNLGVDA